MFVEHQSTNWPPDNKEDPVVEWELKQRSFWTPVLQ